MIQFITKKIFYAMLVMVGVVVLVFFLFQGFGDPSRLVMGQRADAATQENIRKELYLDQPKWKQFVLYLKDVSPVSIHSQAEIDSSKNIFLNLPFYQHLLYNPETKAWLMGVSVDKNVMNSKKRNVVVDDIRKLAENFGKNNTQEVYLSGLPLIRTELSTRVADEMKLFLLASVILSALILLLFFRSFSSMLLSFPPVPSLQARRNAAQFLNPSTSPQLPARQLI